MAATAGPRRQPSGSPGAPSPAGSWPDIVRGLDGGRSDLVPVLQRTQAVYGYVPLEAVHRIARWLKLTESDVFGVATFYSQFRFTPPGRHRVRVCLGTACHVKGGVQLMETLQRRLEISPGETTADGEYDLEPVLCLGCCALAPVVTLDAAIYGQMSVLRLQGILDERDQA